MAYPETQTITDTPRRHVVKLVNFGVTQTDALVVNAAALAYAVRTLTTTAAANAFVAGETVTSTSGGTATVQQTVNSTAVFLYNVVGTFTAADTITGGTSGVTRTQSGALGTPTYTLQTQKIAYTVGGNAGASVVELKWQGNGGGANNRTIAVLGGDGVLDLEALAARVPSNANNSTGNILLTTTNFGAASYYTIVLDVSKQDGFGAEFTGY